MMSRGWLLGMGFAVWAAVAPTAGPAGAAELAIGTGEREGVLYQIGRSMCRLVNAGSEDHGFTCEPLETTGSLFNLANVRGGAIEFGLVRSDLHYHAVNHSGPFAFVDSTYEDLRSLFSLHAELFTVLAQGDAGIEGLDLIAGRRVNIGDWGSTQRAMMDSVLEAKGWTTRDFLLIEELPAAQQSLSFCHERVDVSVIAVAHPDPQVSRVIKLCNAALVGLGAGDLQSLVGANPYYVAGAIPAGTYDNQSAGVPSFGVKVTVVSSAEVAADAAYAVVKSVFEQLDRFKRSNRLLQSLERGDMMVDGLAAPLHEGARRYYEEAGLM